MNAKTLARALGGRRTGNQWPAPCPAHEDTDPSLFLDPASPRRPNKIDAYLEKKGYFGLSLETALFESRPETDPDESTPCPTPSPAPTPGENRRGSGNRCGHDPKHPNFAPPKPKLPKILQKTIEKTHGAYTDPSVLPTLNFHIQGFKVRSERREACIKVLAVFLERTDLATLRVGFPTEHGFLNYDLKYLAALTGMGLRRVNRAVRELKTMGFICISQIRKRLRDGSYRSFAAIKTVSPTLFDALGLRKWLEKERPKARERLRKQEKEHEKECAKSGSGIRKMRQLTAKIFGVDPTSPARHAGAKARKTRKDTPRQIISALTGTRNTDGLGKYLDQLNPEAYAPRQPISVPTGTRGVDPVSKYLGELSPGDKASASQLAIDIKMKHLDWSREKIYEEVERLLPGVYRSPQSVPT